MATTKRYYDESTGLYHVSSIEHGHGLTAYDNKSVSINVTGNNTQTTDYPTNLTVAKLIKADIRAHACNIQGQFFVGVIDSADTTTYINDVADLDTKDGFVIDTGVMFSQADQSAWNYRKVWRPNKYAQSGDKDLFITLDPTNIFTGGYTYGMSIYSVWKIL